MSAPADARLEGYAGRTVLVTGAGSGIGEMLARGLAASGARVGVLDIRAEAAERVASELGGGAFPLVADVADRESLARAADALRARGEGLSLLWINAGVGAGSGLLQASERAVRWVYEVNVLGLVWTAQCFVPLLRETRGPRHLGVTASSASLVSPQAPLTLYAASKHAAFAAAEALRAELAPDGIGTTLLCPGLLNTEIWDAARARPERFGGPRRMDPEVAGRWRAAPHPQILWPHVARTIAGGGGVLVGATEEDTRERFEARADAIRRGWHPL